MCCFEQILDLAPHKTEIIQLLLFSQTSKSDEQVMMSTSGDLSGIIPWTPTQGQTSVSWAVKAYIHQFCADTEYCQEDFPRAMSDRDALQERKSGNLYFLHALMGIKMTFSIWCKMFKDSSE